MSEFNFDMKHLKGKENRVADTLSRKLHCIYEVKFNEVQSKLPNIIKEASLMDPDYAFVWQHNIEAQRGKI